MPVADRVLTQKEGQAVGQHGIKQFDKKFLVAYLGMVLASNPSGDREEMFREIPAPVRLAYRLEPIRLRWMETADPGTGEVLAGRYLDLSAVLNVHLRREVTEVMPVADRVLTQKEGQAVGQHGIKQFDKKFLVAYLGMVLASNPSGDREEMFREIPAPVRLAYRLVGRRMYRRQYATLFPGRAIPDTL